MGDRLKWASVRIVATTEQGHEIQFSFPGEVGVQIETTYRDGWYWDGGHGISIRDPDEVSEVSITLTASRQTGQPHIYEVRRLDG